MSQSSESRPRPSSRNRGAPRVSSRSAELDGGGGFNFEDLVAGPCLADMLLGKQSLDRGVPQPITRVGWQVRQEGWLLNDLLLTLGKAEPSAGRMAVSVKRKRQVTRRGFPTDFIHDAWAHWLHRGTDVFDRDHDFLAMMTGQLAEDVVDAWHDLLDQALLNDDDDGLAERFTSQVGGIKAALFGSLQCPSEFQDHDLCGAVERTQRVQLLRRIRLYRRDFRSGSSPAEGQVIEVCRAALESQDSAEAGSMWSRLIQMASERRPKGGALTRQTLLRELADSFRLLELPDHRAAWQRLNRLAEEALSRVSCSVGRSQTLPRAAVLREIQSHLGPARLTLLAGEPGAGKSALARICCQSWQGGRALWLDGEEVLSLERHLQLGRPVVDLLEQASGRGLLVLDALERWSDQALQCAAKWIEVCAKNGNWSVLGTVRSRHQRRVLDALDGQVEAPARVDIPELDNQELRLLMDELAWLRPLAGRGDTIVLLRNLKALDWLDLSFSSKAPGSAERWLTSSDVIDTLWERWTGSDHERHSRGELMKKLARIEAESMRSSVGRSQLTSDELRVLGSLELCEVVRISPEDRVSFRHDLAGDWARLRLLLERETEGLLGTQIVDLARLPRWEAAIRLYGERLLEKGDAEASQWCALYDSVSEQNAPTAAVTQDLLLESVFSASGATA